MLMEARGGIGALGTKVKKCEPYDVAPGNKSEDLWKSAPSHRSWLQP